MRDSTRQDTQTLQILTFASFFLRHPDISEVHATGDVAAEGTIRFKTRNAATDHIPVFSVGPSQAILNPAIAARSSRLFYLGVGVALVVHIHVLEPAVPELLFHRAPGEVEP